MAINLSLYITLFVDNFKIYLKMLPTLNKTILIHACCGPCAIKPIMHLQSLGYIVTAYFMNPNIHPLAEYLRRRKAMEECAKKLDIKVIYDDKAWNISTWIDMTIAVKDDKESRCALCYQERINSTYLTAQKNNFNYFSTSLLYSRYQNHEKIIELSKNLVNNNSPAFYYDDFRKYWKDGIEIAKEWNIYRQPYCACIFSEAERYNSKLKLLF